MTEKPAPKLLLIVEDEASLTNVLKDVLEKEGFAVAQAATAEAAKSEVKKQIPDLILLDLLLPGMNGMSFLDEVRKYEWGKELPVVILTNIPPDDKIMGAVVRDDPSYYIMKVSTTMDEIVSNIKTALGMQPAAA